MGTKSEYKPGRLTSKSWPTKDPFQLSSHFLKVGGLMSIMAFRSMYWMGGFICAKMATFTMYSQKMGRYIKAPTTFSEKDLSYPYTS